MKLLAQGAKTSIYRSETAEGVLIYKVLSAIAPQPSDLLQLYNELDIAGSLNIDGVRKAVRRDRVFGQPAVVLAHAAGEPLHHGVAKTLQDVKRFLKTALSLTKILAAVHRQRILHLDIRPDNILRTESSPDVTLIDFGNATRLDLGETHLRSVGRVAGTLHYISPEQTGRVDQVVDVRSDLYSLGATLYALVVGRPPFTDRDPIALVHSHIARIPTTPTHRNAVVPAMVSAVIMRLLEKSPEDRYASALGLHHDLARCLALLDNPNAIFELGERDRSAVFSLPQRLFGRETHITALMDTFANNVTQGAQLALVSGAPGVGKSSLIQAVRRRVEASNAAFAACKFDPLQKGVPYGALGTAFGAVVASLASGSDTAIAQWRDNFRAAVGEHGRVLLPMVPNLVDLVGELPAVIALSGAETEARFLEMAHRFIELLSTPSQPLVIFMDDLQWADAASLKLLASVLTKSRARNLLWIGAYRPNEIDAAHALTAALAEMRSYQVVPIRVSLDNLAVNDVRAITAGACGGLSPMIRELAAVVFEKTRGNPLFVHKFLRSLHDRGLLSFDEREAAWVCDVGAVADLDATSNVVDLLTGELERLPESTLTVMQMAAAIGSNFDLTTLAAVHRQPIDTVAEALYAAVACGLVRSDDGALRAKHLGSDVDLSAVRCRFAHDRVHQAVYERIPVADRPTMHAGLGWHLLAAAGDPQGPDFAAQLFQIAYQLNLGVSAISDPKLSMEAASLNCTAGDNAAASAAWDRAWECYAAARQNLGKQGWQRDRSLAMRIQLGGAAAAMLRGDFDTAEVWAKVAIAHQEDILEVIPAYRSWLFSAFGRNDMATVIALCLDVLDQLGVRLPRNPGTPHIILSLLRTKFMLIGHSPESLLDLPRMTDRRTLAAMEIIERLVPASFRAGSNLFPLCVLMLVRLSLKHGNMPVSCFGYAAYAITLCGVLGDYDGAYRFGRMAQQLVDKLEADSHRTQVEFVVHNFVRHWKEPLNDCLPDLLNAYRRGPEIGNVVDAVWAGVYRGMWLFWTGRQLSDVATYLDDTRRSFRAEAGGSALAALLSETIAQLRGLSEAAPDDNNNDDNDNNDPTRLQGAHFDETLRVPECEDSTERIEVAVYHLFKLLLCVLAGRSEQAVTHTEAAERDIEALTGLPYVPILRFWGSLARTMEARRNPAKKRQLIGAVQRARKQLRVWAKHSPSNYQHKLLLVEAELAHCNNRPDRALNLYTNAIESARQGGFMHEEAIAIARAADFHNHHDRPLAARVGYAESSRKMSLWGASFSLGEVADLGTDAVFSPAANATANPAANAGRAELDIDSLMQASAAIAGEIVPERLLRRLVETFVQNAGAERGVLMLERDGALEVVAMRNTASGEVVLAPSPALSEAGSVCDEIVRSAWRRSAPVVVLDASKDGRFKRLPYIITNRVRSVMCQPIIHQGTARGVVYLENNLIAGAFTQARIQMLDLLSSQVAIGLDNARLYADLDAALAREREVSAAQRRFVPHEFLHNLSRPSIADVELGDAVEKKMSILFSDIVGFTSMAEGLSSAETIQTVNDFLGVMEPHIFANSGFVDSYIGDAIMALFDDPDAPVRTALAMLRSLRELNGRRRLADKPILRCGIGINTGALTMGTLGGLNRLKCTVIGDSVNLAARVEGLTRKYGVELVITEHTVASMVDPSVYAMRALDRVQVRGREQTVTIFEVFDADEPQIKAAKLSVQADFESALTHYYDRRFEQALAGFSTCQAALTDDPVVQMWRARAADLNANPPPESWTGEVILGHK